MGDRASKKNIREYDTKLINTITTIFLIYVFVFYPLVLHNKYFDITVTKYTALKLGAVCYAFFAGLAIFMRESDSTIHERSSQHFVKLKDRLCVTDIFMTAFFLSGFISFLVTVDKQSAFTGINGRRCGFQFMIIIFLIYICLSYYYKNNSLVSIAFTVTSCITYILGIMQHLELDILKLLDGVKDSEHDKFMSTFGNINTFAGFICISLSLIMGLYLYEEKCWKRTIYLIAVFLGWGAVIASNSDCAYAGMGMAVILLFFMALRKRKMARFLETLAAGALGYAFLSVIMRLSGQGADKLSGFNAFAKNTKAVIILFLFFVVLLAAYKLFKSMRKQELSDKAINIATVFFVVIFAVAAIGIVIYGRVSGLELFVFNDKWGTYRGYVWKRLLTIWRDFPIYNKIFGYGNESVRALMTSNYYDEMLMVTGTVYDNAHNEYLQYLVTLGIFGLVSFIGLLISAVAICIKHGKKSPVLYALLISICSYAAQAFFNVNQSITTPYLFLMISMAAGTVRYQKEDS